jgi:hypothetical protein
LGKKEQKVRLSKGKSENPIEGTASTAAFAVKSQNCEAPR